MERKLQSDFADRSEAGFLSGFVSTAGVEQLNMERLQPALAWAANASNEIAARMGGFADQATTATRKYGPLFLALLAPISVLPFLLAIWCLGADLGWTAGFPVQGALSRWMIWAGIGAAFQFAIRAYRSAR